MSGIVVVQKTQRIVVDHPSSSIAVVSAGPAGPAGPEGVVTGGTVSAHVTFSYNTTTTEPPIGNQLRLNVAAASQNTATRMWVSQTTVDGLDVTIGLSKIIAGNQVYLQDRDDSSKWVKYNVTADGVDDGSYWDFAISYHSGPCGIPSGQVELQSIAQAIDGIPPGGTIGQALTKLSATDYAVEWTSVPKGRVALATVTSSQGSITSVVDLTGLTVTWTAVSGRSYRTSWHCPMLSTVSGDMARVFLTDASNTQLQDSGGSLHLSPITTGITGFRIDTALSGSTTRKLRAVRGTSGSGVLTLAAGSTAPAFLLVEDIGPTP